MKRTTRQSGRWRVFALLGVTYLITTIDLTIVNVSLPTIGRDLHFSATNLQWVVTAYALTFGGFLLLGGRFADLRGANRRLSSDVLGARSDRAERSPGDHRPPSPIRALRGPANSEGRETQHALAATD